MYLHSSESSTGSEKARNVSIYANEFSGYADSLLHARSYPIIRRGQSNVHKSSHSFTSPVLCHTSWRMVTCTGYIDRKELNPLTLVGR